MQDFVRTSTYQKAILGNSADFNGKVILDVGAGSGILSFFAVQAGANRVYAIEASNMANFAQQLVRANQTDDQISVVPGKIEEIELPQMVDVIISEPMGYMLYNERMLETYLHARKWLKPGGKMFPSEGDLHIAPFTDEALYMEQYNKANFWYADNINSYFLIFFFILQVNFLLKTGIKNPFMELILHHYTRKLCKNIFVNQLWTPLTYEFA